MVERKTYDQLTPAQQSEAVRRNMAWQYDNEAEWRRYVIGSARLAGWTVFYWQDSRRTTPGWPDLALLRVPDFILVELKTNTGRLTRQQQLCIAELQACGLNVHVWRPEDEASVMQYLRRKTK